MKRYLIYFTASVVDFNHYSAQAQGNYTFSAEGFTESAYEFAKEEIRVFLSNKYLRVENVSIAFVMPFDSGIPNLKEGDEGWHMGYVKGM